MHVPLAVLHGKTDGPCLFVTAAVHGDELNGTEIARRLIDHVDPKRLRGTLLVLPVVNVLGFIHGTRYLPDRRDLNRCFPGSKDGSLAAQLAHLVSVEVLARATHGIDLHGGSNHRTNLPQARGDLGDPAARAMCLAFGAPVTMDAKLRSGSLRAQAGKRGIPTLVYEAGEPLRFEELSVKRGFEGVLRVMAHLDMLDEADAAPPAETLVSEKSYWIRASRSGIARLVVEAGSRVEARQVVAEIGDTFGKRICDARARGAGLVIGHSLNPVVNRGDALVHVASLVEEA